MPTYDVTITTEVDVIVTIDAESAVEAEEEATTQFQGLIPYGNGQTVGVNSPNMLLEPSCSWDITNVEEL